MTSRSVLTNGDEGELAKEFADGGVALADLLAGLDGERHVPAQRNAKVQSCCL